MGHDPEIRLSSKHKDRGKAKNLVHLMNGTGEEEGPRACSSLEKA